MLLEFFCDTFFVSCPRKISRCEITRRGFVVRFLLGHDAWSHVGEVEILCVDTDFVSTSMKKRDV